MPVGLGEKFDILTTSPLDRGCGTSTEAADAPPPADLVPSRYNVRATADDGRLVLWNTLSGRLTAFKPSDRPRVLHALRRKGVEGAPEPMVEYLSKRGYLVPRGIDEYRLFQVLFGEQHYRSDVLELILMPSEDCNFRCTYCYEDFARGTMKPEVREGIKNLVRKRAAKLNRFSVSYFGGEPLYGWEAIEDLAPFFVETAEAHGLPFSSGMTTNGYLLTPDRVDKLFEWKVRSFQVTLDGLPEYHDQSRVARDGSPTFDRIFSNLQALSRRDDAFRVNLRVNMDQNNAAGLPEFVQLLADTFEGDTRFLLDLHAVGKWGGPNDQDLNVCGVDEAETLKEDLLAQARRQGLPFRTLRGSLTMGSQVCYAARPYNFLIGATGKVMKCTIVLDKDENNVVGRLTHDGELEIDQRRMYVWTEPAFEQDDQCRKCVMVPNCQGIHCPLVRMEENRQPCISARLSPRSALLSALDHVSKPASTRGARASSSRS